MRKYTIQTSVEKVTFIGEALTDIFKPNWQFFITDKKEILSFKESKIVYIREEILKSD